ncbi:hypothetical protein G6L37_01705 [Agrobacterium rubi]|nr:hypothetical protein [Agrobacterium rubi]NTF24109.1 hypothetical protein [Agrobacterium rubi]
MSYETRYATIREDLRDIISEVAQSFGADVEGHVGDSYGYEFVVDAADGELIRVTLLLEDGADHGFDDGGNAILRATKGDEEILTVAPHNRTGEVFAFWGDDELWDDKIDNLRANVASSARSIGRAVSHSAKP